MLYLYNFSRAIILGAALFCFSLTKAQAPTTIHTSGPNLLGVCGDTIVLRGINYAPYDWGSDNTQLLLNQVALTGANVVRMTWYDNTTAPYYTDSLLDSAIGACIANKMIAIIELHDLTCDPSTADVDTLINWYLKPNRLAIFQKYQSSLIIDIANELGYVNWSGNIPVAQLAYEVAYDTAVNKMRRAGITVPLMIDAPDCGSSIDILGNVASNIIASDPLHNVIFSAHAYWYAYANNDSATMRQDIGTALTYNFPLVLGEIANYQDSTPAYCTWSLNYPALLRICTELNVGWLAWSWNNDNCSLRQLSTDGTYANLSTYGMDIVNNAIYGLHNSAKLTAYLKNGECTTGIEDIAQPKPYLIYNDNGTAYLKSQCPETMQVREFDILGRQIWQGQLAPGQTLPLAAGEGLVLVKDGETQYTSRFISLQ